ncbi:MFS transporter [Candidatus Micrarchaeota archaeon]|nr:MFS transporter [Candidatus Micrarchaeota archaeon]
MRELSQVYVHTFLWSIGGRMIGIFVPSYLLSIGYPLTEVLIYNVIWSVGVALVSPLAVHVQPRIGVKKMLSVGVLIQAAFLLLILTVEGNRWPVLFLSAVNGVYAAVYFTSRFSLFSAGVKKGEEGKSSSMLFSMVSAAELVAPLVMAVLINKFGFGAVSLISIGFIVASVVPLFLSKDVSLPVRRPWRKIYSRPNLRYFMLYAQDGLLSFTILYWPLYAFITNSNFLAVGGAASLMQVGVLIYTLLVGRFVDRHSKIMAAALGSLGNGVLFGLLVLMPSRPEIVLAVSVLIGFVQRSWLVSMFAITTEQARKQDVARWQAFRETGVGVGRMLVTTPAAVAASLLGGFGISALACIAFGLAELAKGKRWFGK